MCTEDTQQAVVQRACRSNLRQSVNKSHR